MHFHTNNLFVKVILIKVILDSLSFVSFILLTFFCFYSCSPFFLRLSSSCNSYMCCSMLLPSAGPSLSRGSELSGCPLMTAFVKPTARLFLGSAVNRQIPHPRLEMFSALCRALVCTGLEKRTERVIDGRQPERRRKRKEGERWRR